jgi:anti-sigma regulatory factor (Ser/Thr protein kinase)
MSISSSEQRPIAAADTWSERVARQMKLQADVCGLERGTRAPRTDLADTSSADGFSFLLDGGHDVGGEARRALVAGDGKLPAAVRADVLLLLTELVTNAVRHGGVGSDQSLRVEVWQWPQLVRVEVVDPGTRFTQVRPGPRRDQSGGWGLFLVDRIADSWGVARAAAGTCVWFEIEMER